MHATTVSHHAAGDDPTILVTEFGMIEDTRLTNQGNRVATVNRLCVGNVYEVLIPNFNMVPIMTAAGDHPQLVGSTVGGTWLFQDLALNFNENRTFFVLFNDVGDRANIQEPSVFWFHTKDAQVSFSYLGGVLRVVTQVPVYGRVAVLDANGDVIGYTTDLQTGKRGPG